MRLAAVAALALAFCVSAGAHITGHRKDDSLRATLAFQQKNYAHAHYVCSRGSGEVKRWHCAWLNPLRREISETYAKMAYGLSPVSAITTVFGPYASQALSVARCESGLSVYATNGQYVNLFQMGYHERQTYGWHVAGSPAIVAARSAYNYFRASGYRWTAWACQP